MSRFFDAIGTAFFMGKRNGRYVTGNMLYGALLMIHDATEKAGSEDDSLLIKIFKKSEFIGLYACLVSFFELAEIMFSKFHLRRILLVQSGIIKNISDSK